MSRKGRGVRATLTRETPLPLDTEFSWGLIRLVDRVPVTNEYLTFGGHLSVAPVDDASVAVFTSPAPLLRRGGHSQLWDEGADLLAAFFARLVGAIDVRPGLEPRLAQVDPRVRYAAFLGDVVGRYRRSPALRAADAEAWRLLEAEELRLRRTDPDCWHTGTAILEEVGRPLVPGADRRPALGSADCGVTRARSGVDRVERDAPRVDPDDDAGLAVPLLDGVDAAIEAVVPRVAAGEPVRVGLRPIGLAAPRRRGPG